MSSIVCVSSIINDTEKDACQEGIISHLTRKENACTHAHTHRVSEENGSIVSDHPVECRIA